ncbi:hypothetical protein [Streptomyces carminius]|nr:hypothetical protein [Streptomyces carminius]
MARALKPLRRPISEQPTTLTVEEQEILAQCTAAVDTLQWAFWLAGKALESIREGRLYRAETTSFDEFVWKRWGMRKAYANKLIQTWRIAEAVFEFLSNEVAPIGATSRKPSPLAEKAEDALRALNQAQVWELVPVADAWDVDTATLVFRTAIEVDGVRVTAKVLKGAVEALPKEADAAEIVKHVRSYLTSSSSEEDENGPIDFTEKAERSVPYNWVRRLAKRDATAATRYLDALQEQIDRCRAELIPQQQQPEPETVQEPSLE